MVAFITAPEQDLARFVLSSLSVIFYVFPGG